MSVLNVNSEELMEAKQRVDNLLSNFNNDYRYLIEKFNELETYWIGEDYLVTKNNVLSNIKPYLDENDGSIPNLLKDLSSELERRYTDYEDIQKANMREDY